LGKDDFSVLDLACGAGPYSRMWKSMTKGEVIGVDISDDMLEIARQKAKEENLDIKYV